MSIIVQHVTLQAVGRVHHIELVVEPVPVGNDVVYQHEQDLPGNWLQHGGLQSQPNLTPDNIKLVDNLGRWKQ